MSSTLVRDAASTSMRSVKRPWAMASQFWHFSQGVELTPSLQFRHLARILAMVVLPTPRVPVNR